MEQSPDGLQLVALPGVGETTPVRTVIDVRNVDGSGTTLSIAEATARYDVSRATLQRRLADGAIPGACKQATPRGEEWRLPVAALDLLFQPVADPASSAPQKLHHDVSQEAADLFTLVADLRADLRHERDSRRVELMAAFEDRHKDEGVLRAALVEAAEARTRLQAVEAERDELRTVLEHVRESLREASSKRGAAEADKDVARDQLDRLSEEYRRLVVELAEVRAHGAELDRTIERLPGRWQRRLRSD